MCSYFLTKSIWLWGFWIIVKECNDFGEQVEHKACPVFLPFDDRAFLHTENLTYRQLSHSKLKSPLLDVLANSSGVLRDF